MLATNQEAALAIACIGCNNKARSGLVGGGPMRVPAIAVALATTVCLSLPSYAATLQSVTGEVFINGGAGYQPAASGSQAKVGDVIMAVPNARAQLVYPDKCTVEVKPGAVITVRAESPCAGAYAQVEEQCKPGDSRWECNAGGYIIGAGALTGIGVGIYFLTQKDDAPASP